MTYHQKTKQTNKHMSDNWNAKVMFPSDSNFVNRITDISFGPSKSSNNPMITMECEVVSPEEVDVGGKMVNIAGVKTTNYYTTQVLESNGDVDVEATEKCLHRLVGTDEEPGLFRILFPENPERWKVNPENPDLSGIVGKVILTQMSPDIQEQRKTPTSAEIAEAKKTGTRPQGQVMKHPVTGKPLVQYWPKIREIFALAPSNIASGATGNKPY